MEDDGISWCGDAACTKPTDMKSSNQTLCHMGCGDFQKEITAGRCPRRNPINPEFESEVKIDSVPESLGSGGRLYLRWLI